MTKLAIIYYSATGHGTTMAQRVAAVAESAGAEVRLRHVAETQDPASFAHNPAWTANYEATKDLPAATGDDIVWADAVIFGSPTRFGSPAAQLRAFLDSLGGLWAQGKLADKVYAGFTSSNTVHGGQETTLLSLYITLMHFGGIIVPRATRIRASSSTATPTGSAWSPRTTTSPNSTSPPRRPSSIWPDEWSKRRTASPLSASRRRIARRGAGLCDSASAGGGCR